jgi:hypothetical protein
MSKVYHVLLSRDGAGQKWGVEFGDWKRADVAAELADHRDHGAKASNLKIITCGAEQAAIDAAVAALNAKAVA